MLAGLRFCQSAVPVKCHDAAAMPRSKNEKEPQRRRMMKKDNRKGSNHTLKIGTLATLGSKACLSSRRIGLPICKLRTADFIF